MTGYSADLTKKQVQEGNARLAKHFRKLDEVSAMYEALVKLDNSLDEVPGDLWGEVAAILERIDND